MSSDLGVRGSVGLGFIETTSMAEHSVEQREARAADGSKEHLTGSLPVFAAASPASKMAKVASSRLSISNFYFGRRGEWKWSSQITTLDNIIEIYCFSEDVGDWLHRPLQN